VELVLSEVLHVPALKDKFLISVPKLVEKGCSIEFNANGAQVKMGNHTLLECTVRNGIYLINATIATKTALTTTTQSKSITEWHRIFGHLNFKDVQRLPSVVDGVRITTQEHQDCEVCLKSKATRKSFAKMSTKSLMPGDRQCVDIGFIDGTPYLTITDDASGCTKTSILQKKSDAASEIIEYVKWLKTQFNIIVKEIRCDGAEEFKTKELKNFYSTNGIELSISQPYTPEQNGVAERKNRTLKETARSIIADSKLDAHNYGTDALLFATFMRNRSPKADTGKTPIEILTGSKPNAINYERFGKLGYATLHKNQKKNLRLSTLDEKAVKCILLGFSSTGYELEEIATGKRFSSCHVKWLDDDMPIEEDTEKSESEQTASSASSNEALSKQSDKPSDDEVRRNEFENNDPHGKCTKLRIELNHGRQAKLTSVTYSQRDLDELENKPMS
jgi:hypothetical protein